MRPLKDAMNATIGDDGRLVATSSATYFQTNAGNSSQTPPAISRITLRMMAPRQGLSSPSRRRKMLGSPLLGAGGEPGLESDGGGMSASYILLDRNPHL